jgi:hypothetical protein
MRQSPVFSIVIPTRNRYEYLTHMLRALVKFPSRNFEIVVADNTVDNRQMRELIEALADDRIVYAHSAVPMNMHQNCERAIDGARGTYVCMLGDDDGLLEWTPALAEWMEATGIDAVLANLPIYRWPGVVSRILGTPDVGYVVYERPTGVTRQLDVTAELEALARSGGTRLHMVPRVYQGIVRRTSLLALKSAHGTYFPGPSPDIANAVGLAPFVKVMVYVDVPVIVSGTSPKSAGGQGSAGAHVGELTSVQSLPPGTAESWDPRIPRFWSGPTIWAEASLKALELTNSPARADFNFAFVYASCLVFHWDYRRHVWPAMHALSVMHGRSRVDVLMSVTWNIVGIGNLRVRALLRTILFRLGVSRFARISALPTIGECLERIREAEQEGRRPWSIESR